MHTHTVDGNAFSVQAYGDLGALSLLVAADATDAGSMYTPVAGAYRVRQRSQRKRRANFLVGRHDFARQSVAVRSRSAWVVVSLVGRCAGWSQKKLRSRTSFSAGGESGPNSWRSVARRSSTRTRT